MRRALAIAEIGLSFGLCLLIKRLGVDPRWRRALWLVIACNEARGIVSAFYGARWYFGV